MILYFSGLHRYFSSLPVRIQFADSERNGSTIRAEGFENSGRERKFCFEIDYRYVIVVVQTYLKHTSRLTNNLVRETEWTNSIQPQIVSFAALLNSNFMASFRPNCNLQT
jgi:hypothetical protein